MTRRRVQISLFSGRPTVVTPYDTGDICPAARRYHVGWLLVGDEDRRVQPDLVAFVRTLTPVARSGDTVLYRLRC